MPRNHTRSDVGGCPECKKELMGIKFRKPNEKFIEEARILHGDRYDYSKTEYTKIKEKVVIICPDHGEFIQTSGDHLQGNGCPTCGGYSFWKSKIDTSRNAYLYLMLLEGNGEKFLKIGVSINPNQRASQIQVQTKNEYRVAVLSCISGNANECATVERLMRNVTKKYVPQIKFGGWTECVEYDDVSWLTDEFNKEDDCSWM